MTRKELKEQAKQNLRGNWKWAVLTVLPIWIITMIGRYLIRKQNGNYSVTLFGSIILIVATFTTISLAISFLHFNDSLGKAHDKPIKSAFKVYDTKYLPDEFATFILFTFCQFLWTLLLIIPGIIKGYAYAMVPYITTDLIDSNQTVNPTKVVEASDKLMKGHKMDLFILRLSFIGWDILAACTLGIGLLWLAPYRNSTYAIFYRKLAGNKFRQ